ncbi:MAG: stage II sporulation protein M [Firmicutes bacterium]|nr:stage II sporulation protein M [Bacillota bacterium]
MARGLLWFLGGTGLLSRPAVLLTALVFLAGGLLGAVNAARLEPPAAAELKVWLQGSLGPAPFERALAASVGQYAGTIGALYLSGLTAVGIPALLAIVFLRGLAAGFTVTFLVREMSWSGVWIVLTCLLPPALVYFPALVAAGAAALSFAVVVLRHCWRGGATLWPGFVAYSAVMLVFALSGLGAGLVAAVLPPLTLRQL